MSGHARELPYKQNIFCCYIKLYQNSETGADRFFCGCGVFDKKTDRRCDLFLF